MTDFLNTLSTQRWDDHRFYHQSRINQSLHFLSAIGFLVAYGMLFVDPAVAALIAWGFSMVTRQAGHFFFEPRGFDHVNQVSDAHKEAVKVGYNIQRKVILLSIWAGIPLVLYVLPSLGGLIAPASSSSEFLHDVGMAWLALGVAGVLFRVAQLTLNQGPLEAVAWAFKIITDPAHDIVLYHKAPLALLRGELLDPMPHVRHR